jgi:hypothetical protein
MMKSMSLADVFASKDPSLGETGAMANQTTIAVYDTEEQAKGGLQEIGFELGGVKVTSSEVYRLPSPTARALWGP